jgi:hypothetical protein
MAGFGQARPMAKLESEVVYTCFSDALQRFSCIHARHFAKAANYWKLADATQNRPSNSE